MKLVLYDGDCGVCNRFVQFVLRHDSDHRIHFAPLQGSTAKNYLTGPTDLSTVIFVDEGTMHFRSEGAIRTMASLGGKWRLLKIFLLVPKFIRDFVYNTIARNRHRISASLACPIPTAEQRQQFLP